MGIWEEDDLSPLIKVVSSEALSGFIVPNSRD